MFREDKFKQFLSVKDKELFILGSVYNPCSAIYHDEDVRRITKTVVITGAVSFFTGLVTASLNTLLE